MEKALVGGQAEVELGPAPFSVRDEVNLATVVLDDLLADPQPQPRPASALVEQTK